MALITCPECGQEISDKAYRCPKCGCPILAQASQTAQPNRPVQTTQATQTSHVESQTQTDSRSRQVPESLQPRKNKSTVWLLVLLGLAILIIGILTGLLLQKSEKDSAQQEGVKEEKQEKQEQESNTVKDIDGNVYKTVKIGKQVWMAENLRTTRYANGMSIPMGSTTSTTTAYRYNPNDNADNVRDYGYLYNWPAVMHGTQSSNSNPSGVQGICPDGWYVPSDAEWTQLTNYVSSQTQYQCNGSSENIAKALASTTGWSSSSNTCAVGNNPSANNSTVFSALPAGGYYGGYDDFGYLGDFWSATEYNGDGAYTRGLFYDYAGVLRDYSYRLYGFSVRCLRD